MTSSELRKYMGGKTACDSCKRSFEKGKRIIVDPINGYVFCYSEVLDSCMTEHFKVTRETIMGHTMIFGGPLDDRMELVRRILDDWEEETPV